MDKPFNQRITYKKGELAEQIADKIMIGRGHMPYSPTIDGPHPFDRTLVNLENHTMMMMDVKAVSARYTKGKWAGKGYPDTGISIAHRNTYLQYVEQSGLPLLLLFVDCEMGEVYGNVISILEKPVTIEHNKRTLNYPMIADNNYAVGGKIVYYPIDSMQRNLYHLNDEEIAELRSTSNYGYKKDVKPKSKYRSS